MCEKLKKFSFDLNHLKYVDDINFITDYIVKDCKCDFCLKLRIRYRAIKKIILILKQIINKKKYKFNKKYKNNDLLLWDNSRTVLLLNS